MMERTDETIPSREELAVYIEEAAVSVTNNYEEAPAVLMVDDAVIGTLGNFSASIGKAKSKKTFNVSAIAASALSGRTVLRYRSMFPENKSKILYIDTEQGRHHCQQVLKRILRLAEMPDDKVPENLVMLSLRKFAPRMRLLIVEEAIGTTPDLGLVIIDGIRDFLYDINSSSESTEVISKFMQWTDDKQIHIHTVLHQNKNDEHARDYKACYFLNTIIGYNLYEWEILILRSANTSLLNTDFLSIFQTPLSCAKWNIYVIFLSFFSKLIPLHVGLAGIQKK